MDDAEAFAATTRHVFDARLRTNRVAGVDVRWLQLEIPATPMEIRSGMFCMLRCPEPDFPFLNRPFSILDYEVDSTGSVARLDFLIKEVGPGTRRLARKQVGDSIQVIGPLGRGFPPGPRSGSILMVSGGVGIVPLFLRWRELGRTDPAAARVLLLYGARDHGRLYLHERLERERLSCRFATEDGSRGWHGRVDGLLTEELSRRGSEVAQILACGPEPMLRVVSEHARTTSIPCFLALETHMGCGFGVCNGCAVKVRDVNRSEGYRYDRSCREGPVFSHDALLWEDR